MLTGFFKLFKRLSPKSSSGKQGALPRIITRSEHIVSRNQIGRSALKVLYRLKDAHYAGYLVGGSVRDLLLGQRPKDFDIATNALPEEVADLFRNCRLIGRRFRLAHVYFGNDLVEVATFRGGQEEVRNAISPSDVLHSDEGMILRDNVYGTLEEDVWRRDFTVNALYYNIADFSIVDYVGGMKDLKNRCLRLIGHPEVRYREDPVRMLRAVRFAAKLGFTLHEKTEEPIAHLKHLLQNVSSARIFEEYLKLFMGGYALAGFKLLKHYGLLEELLPQMEPVLSGETKDQVYRFWEHALENTDARVAADKSVAPPFLLAAFFWPALQHEIREGVGRDMSEYAAFHGAQDLVLRQRQKTLSIPRRYTIVVKEIWLLQFYFEKRIPRRVQRLLAHQRFRAAYDFLLLRAVTEGGPVQALAQWWSAFLEADEDKRVELLKKVAAPNSKRKRRSPKKPKPKVDSTSHGEDR